MERFAPVLRRVDRELEVRDPERSRILLELAGDLEEMYRAYRSRGCSEEEARRRAEAWLAPDDASLGGLRRLHTPLAGRLLDSLSDVARSRLETATFTVLALGAVAAGLWGLRDTVFLWPPRPAAAAPEALWDAVAAAAGTAALGVIVALVLGLAWFWLAARVRLVRGARAELREIAPYLEPEIESSSDGRSR